MPMKTAPPAAAAGAPPRTQGRPIRPSPRCRTRPWPTPWAQARTWARPRTQRPDAGGDGSADGGTTCAAGATECLGQRLRGCADPRGQWGAPMDCGNQACVSGRLHRRLRPKQHAVLRQRRADVQRKRQLGELRRLHRSDVRRRVRDGVVQGHMRAGGRSMHGDGPPDLRCDGQLGHCPALRQRGLHGHAVHGLVHGRNLRVLGQRPADLHEWPVGGTRRLRQSGLRRCERYGVVPGRLRAQRPRVRHGRGGGRPWASTHAPPRAPGVLRAPAPTACVNGACAGVCVPGTTKCSGNGVQTCGSDGQWSGAVACSNQACVSGACVGSCTPTTTTCSNNGVETCSASGTYGSPVACANSACVGGRMHRAVRAGDDPVFGPGRADVRPNGNWGAAVACTNSACVANGGIASCQGTCNPGASQCSGNSAIQIATPRASGERPSRAPTGMRGQTTAAARPSARECAPQAPPSVRRTLAAPRSTQCRRARPRALGALLPPARTPRASWRTARRLAGESARPARRSARATPPSRHARRPEPGEPRRPAPTRRASVRWDGLLPGRVLAWGDRVRDGSGRWLAQRRVHLQHQRGLGRALDLRQHRVRGWFLHRVVRAGFHAVWRHQQQRRGDLQRDGHLGATGRLRQRGVLRRRVHGDLLAGLDAVLGQRRGADLQRRRAAGGRPSTAPTRRASSSTAPRLRARATARRARPSARATAFRPAARREPTGRLRPAPTRRAS